MSDFYVGLGITLAILTCNLVGFAVGRIQQARRENKKTIALAISESYTNASREKTILVMLPNYKVVEKIVIPPPPWFVLTIIFTLLEISYGLLLVFYPEVLGFTLFNKAIDQPFYFRIYSAFILAIDIPYLFICWNFYSFRSRPKEDNLMQRQMANLLQLYIIGIIKSISYGFSFAFAHLFLFFESAISNSYVPGVGSPGVWIILSALLNCLLTFFYGRKAWLEHKYIMQRLPLG